MLIKQVFPESISNPSSYCKYFYRCEQSSGDIENKVSGAALAVKNSGFLDGTLWSAAGYANLGGGTGNYCTVASSTHDVTLNGYSLVVTARIQKTAGSYPGAEQYFIASYNPGSSTGGIIVSCRTDGAVRMYANSVSGSTVSVTSAAGVLWNGTSNNERSVVFIFPRESGVSAYVGVDAIESSSSPASSVAGLTLAGGNTMRIGGNLAGGSIDGYKLAAIAAYQVPVDLGSLDRKQLYDWAFRNPGTPMPDWIFE